MPYKLNESKRHHIPKQRYKLVNWSEYNQALKNRGRIDLWLSDDIETWWTHSDRVYDGTGSSQHYTDQAILTCHELRVIFKIPLRQLEGLVDSLFETMGLPLKCPHYSLLSKRLAGLNIPSPRYKKGVQRDERTVAIAFDSTGLKRYGRDEWHQEKHKVSSKRSWRKLHLGVGDDHVIYSTVLTDKNTMDDAATEALCDQIEEEVSMVSADRAYDENHVYKTVEAHFPEADIIIPPKDYLHYNENHHPKRCAHMIEIAAKGQQTWQQHHQYGKRSGSETAMQRYKRTFGNQLHAREMSNQEIEVMIACGVLNRFTSLGMPQSYKSV
ncbi:IS5 family transposase [Zooshikella ganghwensis]|uniref:IS5 family transposase n=1 Tax=Zooshikella ganghwensis TaxID=202772 RepID=A0A4P9VE33_9GAMM|nr:IS5 family transposase [Zooshikella ganghwensis]RDH41318.1 IS5 family transposase [Zooshikella ganghwensis]